MVGMEDGAGKASIMEGNDVEDGSRFISYRDWEGT